MIAFLKDKLADINLGTLLFMELESWMYWIFNTIPGSIGILLRNLTYQIFFREKKGIVWTQPRVIIVESNKLSIGRNCGINSGTYINAKGTIEMGDNVLIGSNVTISSGMHPIEGKYPPVFARPTIPKKIIIEDDVWIGAGAVIMPGITLRKGTVIGANTVVTKNTEEYSVVVGYPGRIIKYRDEK